jgi:hypothetical protein
MEQTQSPAQRPVLFAPLYQQRISQREILYGVHNRLSAYISITTNAQDLASLSRELRETMHEIRRLSASIEKKEAHDAFDRALHALVKQPLESPCAAKSERPKKR